jgi:hypothetical protein
MSTLSNWLAELRRRREALDRAIVLHRHLKGESARVSRLLSHVHECDANGYIVHISNGWFRRNSYFVHNDGETVSTIQKANA